MKTCPPKIFMWAEKNLSKGGISGDFRCRTYAVGLRQQKKTEVQMRLASRLLQYWSTGGVQTLSVRVCVCVSKCVFNIYMDALSMHSKGSAA